MKRSARWALPLLSTCVLAVAIAVPRPAAAAGRLVTAAVVMDGPWQHNEAILAGLKKEIAELTRDEFDVRYLKIITGDWTSGRVKAALDELMAMKGLDVVIAFGVLASHDAARRDVLPKPVIAPLVLDPKLQKLPLTRRGTSGKKNLSYLVWSWEPGRDLAVFHDVFPYKRLTVLVAEPYAAAMPELRETSQKLIPELAGGFDSVRVKQSAAEALAQIPEHADAVYVGPLLHLSEPERDKLIAGLIDKQLPSFSALGRSEVVRGMLAGHNAAVNFDRLLRRVAINLQRILLGEDAGGLAIEFQKEERLVINMSTARAVGFYPSWRVLTEAELIKQKREGVVRKVNLLAAVKEALAVNLDLAVANQAVRAGEHEVDLARASLLPQVDLGVAFQMIDADRARASNGAAPERTLDGSLNLTQVLYAEGPWANLHIQQKLQEGREAGRQVTRLDVVLEATHAHLNLLRARTFERIMKENLKRTRRNLELARLRTAVGSSGPAEVYRWESQIASDRSAVISANSQRNLAEMQLNRVLRRPLEEPFEVEEASLSDTFMVTSDKRIFEALHNPWHFKVFRRFMVEQCLAGSPDITQIDVAMQAQKRVITAAKRSFWVPQIALQGSLFHRFVKSGAGSEPTSFELPDTLPIPADTFAMPTADDTGWSLGIQLRLPLFEGAGRFAEVSKQRAELRRLEILREATVQKIEQRVRSALHQAGGSFPAIRLSEDAAKAAHKNLDLVTDAYSRGAVPILVLIDAQNAARNADAAAANAVYVFLLDFMSVHRAVGSFYFLLEPHEKEAWLNALRSRLEQAGRRAR